MAGWLATPLRPCAAKVINQALLLLIYMQVHNLLPCAYCTSDAMLVQCQLEV